MLHITLLNRRIKLSFERNDARIVSVLAGLTVWMFAAEIASNSESSLNQYAGPVATGAAIVVAVVTNLISRLHTFAPPGFQSYVRHVEDAYFGPASALNRIGNLVGLVAVLPLAVGTATWGVAYGLVKVLELVFGWQQDVFDVRQAFTCFFVSWLVLSLAVVLLCWWFTTSVILNPVFWRAVDYPWVLTAAVTIIFSAQDQRFRGVSSSVYPYEFTASDRWHWYLMLAVLVAFRLTRTTAEVLRDAKHILEHRLPPHPLDVIRQAQSDINSAMAVVNKMMRSANETDQINEPTKRTGK
jgi:hypothetical protein